IPTFIVAAFPLFKFLAQLVPFTFGFLGSFVRLLELRAPFMRFGTRTGPSSSGLIPLPFGFLGAPFQRISQASFLFALLLVLQYRLLPLAHMPLLDRISRRIPRRGTLGTRAGEQGGETTYIFAVQRR